MVVDAGLGFGKSTQAAVEAKKKPVKKRVNFCRRRKVCGKGEWARLDEMPPPRGGRRPKFEIPISPLLSPAREKFCIQKGE